MLDCLILIKKNISYYHARFILQGHFLGELLPFGGAIQTPWSLKDFSPSTVYYYYWLEHQVGLMHCTWSRQRICHSSCPAWCWTVAKWRSKPFHNTSPGPDKSLLNIIFGGEVSITVVTVSVLSRTILYNMDTIPGEWYYLGTCPPRLESLKKLKFSKAVLMWQTRGVDMAYTRHHIGRNQSRCSCLV
jgi:hypothetical protein